MIELQFTGMCKDCKCADLELEDVQLYEGREWSVRCNHSEACDSMEDKTIERMRGEQG